MSIFSCFVEIFSKRSLLISTDDFPPGMELKNKAPPMTEVEFLNWLSFNKAELKFNNVALPPL